MAERTIALTSKVRGPFERFRGFESLSHRQLDMIISLLPKIQKKTKKCWKKLLKAEAQHKRKKVQKLQRKLLRLNIIIGRFRR